MSDRYQRAIELFYKAHQEDPKGESVRYHETVASWVEQLGSQSDFAGKYA